MMLIKELITILSSEKFPNKTETICQRLNISRATLSKIMKGVDGVSFNFKEKKWKISNEVLDLDRNLLVEHWLQGNPSKPNNYKWCYSKDINLNIEEVMEIIDQINSYHGNNSRTIREEHSFRLAVYIVEFLDHPLDTLLVNETMVKEIKGKFDPHHILKSIYTMSGKKYIHISINHITQATYVLDHI